LIKLAFRSFDRESLVLLRGTYFRICPDETLRGPDNSIAARYVDGLWYLGHRRHRGFECNGPVCLRIRSVGGHREYLGPYEFLKASDGAIFTRDGCLGVHSLRRGVVAEGGGLWSEIVLLTADEVLRYSAPELVVAR
jgi:hypothetical protein